MLIWGSYYTETYLKRCLECYQVLGSQHNVGLIWVIRNISRPLRHKILDQSYKSSACYCVTDLAGPIPTSLAALTKLVLLWLQDNQLTGETLGLPSFKIRLICLNVMQSLENLLFVNKGKYGNFVGLNKRTQFNYLSQPSVQALYQTSRILVKWELVRKFDTAVGDRLDTIV